MKNLKFGGGGKKKGKPTSGSTSVANAPATKGDAESIDDGASSNEDDRSSVYTPSVNTPYVSTPVAMDEAKASSVIESVGIGDSDSDADSASQAPSAVDEKARKKKKKGGMFGLKVPKALRGGSSKKKSVSAIPPEAEADASKASPQQPLTPSGKLSSSGALVGTAASSPPDAIKALKARLEEAEQQSRNLEVERDNLQLILESKDLTIGKLKDEVDDLERRLNELVPESKSPKALGKIDDFAMKLRECQNQLEREKREKSQIQSELEALQEELEETRREVVKLNGIISEMKVEKENLERELQSQKLHGLSSQDEDIKLLQLEVQEWKAKALQAQAKLDNEVDKADALKSTESTMQSLGWRSDLENLRKTQEEEKRRFTSLLQRAQKQALDRENELKDKDEEIETLARKLKRQVEDTDKVVMEKDMIEKELTALRSDVLNLRSDLDDAIVQKEELARELEASKRQQDSLSERIRVLSQDEDASRKHLLEEAELSRVRAEEKEKEVSKLERALAEADKAQVRMKEELSNAEAKIKSLDALVVKLRAELSDAQRMGEDEVSKLSSMRNSAEKELNSTRNELSQLQVKHKETEDTFKKLQTDYEELKEAKNTMENKLSRLQKLMDENSKQAKESENFKIAQLQDTVKELRTSKKDLSQQLNAKSMEFTKIENELSLLKMQYTVIENTNKELQQQIKSLADRGSEMTSAMSAKELELQRQLMELNGVKEMQSVQIGSYQQKEAELKRNLTEAKQEVDKLQDRLSQAKKELSGAQIELSILERKYADLSQENQQLKELNDELKRTSASVLQDTLKSSQQQSFEVEKLRMKTQQLERANEDLQREISSMSARMGESETSKTSLKTDYEKAKQRVSNLEDEIRTLEKRLADSEAQVGTMKVSLQEAFKRETHLTEEISKLKRGNERRTSRITKASKSLPQEESSTDDSPIIPSLPAGPPAATIFSNVIASIDGARAAFKTVRCPEGTLEVVLCLKQRLLDCLFETFGPRVPNGQIMGGMFREVFNSNYARANFKESAERPEVLRVLSRVKKLWELGEDLRLALVQGDPTLAEIFQLTRTTHADWESTLAALRGSAEIIEERNQTLERLAAGYASSLEEIRTLAKVDREKAKSIVATLKKQLHNSEELRTTAERERDELLHENEALQDQLKSTIHDNSRLIRRNAPTEVLYPTMTSSTISRPITADVVSTTKLFPTQPLAPSPLVGNIRSYPASSQVYKGGTTTIHKLRPGTHVVAPPYPHQ